MVALVSMAAFAIDAATFFVVKRELQSTADAAALAGVPYLGGFWGETQPIPYPDCVSIVNPFQQAACTYVNTYINANAENATTLCQGPVTNTIIYPTRSLDPSGTPLSPALQVTVHCDARFFLGGIANLHLQPINATGSAVLGSWDSSVPPQIVNFIGSRPAARLVAPVPTP